MALIQTFAGLVLLFFAGDALVRGGVGLGLHLRLSTLFIGITVIAFGTSAPELLVSVQAVLAGAPSMALGNAIGSNIVNIFLILGVASLIGPLVFNRQEVLTDYLLMSGATVLFVAFCWFFAELDTLQGVLLLILLTMSIYYSWHHAKKLPHEPPEEVKTAPKSLLFCLIFLAIGIVGLPIGAHFLIEGARALALMAGISEAAIALIMVAIGTSLPELVTSIAAAMHRKPEMVLGNVIGSNIFNLLGVMGAASIAGKIPVESHFLYIDTPVMMLATFSLAPFLFARLPMRRAVGIGYCVAYLVYMTTVLSS